MCVLFCLPTSPVYSKMHCIIYMFMSTFLLAHLTKITINLCRQISLTKQKVFYTRPSLFCSSKMKFSLTFVLLGYSVLLLNIITVTIDFNAKRKQDGAEMYSESDVRIHLHNSLS